METHTPTAGGSRHAKDDEFLGIGPKLGFFMTAKDENPLVTSIYTIYPLVN